MSKTKDIKLCIFDLDGVIVNTAKYHYLAWKKLAKSFDYDLTEEKNEELKGVSRVQSLENILTWAGATLTKEEKLTYATRKNEWYVESIQDIGRKDVLSGVVEFINDLKLNNCKSAIGSASKNARLILERLEIIDLFDAIIDGTNTINGKPDPEVFLKGAKATSTPAENSLVFEDASKGIDAALSANMTAVGIGEEKELGHAHIVLSGFVDLNYKDLIKKIQ